MSKLLSLLFILTLPNTVLANSPQEDALQLLNSMNPSSILPYYTNNPREAQLKPDENINNLNAEAQHSIETNSTAKQTYEQAQIDVQSHPATPDQNDPEMFVAGKIIDNANSSPDDIACGSGQCDSAKVETSDDIQEGIIRLGSLAGSAEAVAANQVHSGEAAIFRGQPLECKKYIIGFRDCCTDGGWGDWIKSCPGNLQELQRAKHENRAVYLGSYKKHRLDLSHLHVYCVFPSKLAGIVQIQGRANQLHIPFGQVKSPNCRGLTPEELERINFKLLDLSALTQEWLDRKAIPDSAQQDQHNQSHIEQLNREGRAHD